MGISLPWGARVAVLELFGPISGSGKLTSHIDIIDKVKKNQRIKSVIIHIDSTGGLATASDHLYTALCKLSAKKPLVAFISGAGASGAYLISCAATRIVALPTSVVGSIGVLSVRPVLQDLLQRVGVHITVTKSGRLKDMGYPFRPPSEEEQEKEQELINGFYDYFVKVVARGRHISEDIVKELATGEVFLGEKARSLKLVDEIGDFDTALDIAAKLGNAPRRVIYFRPHPPLTERLLSRFATSLVEETLAAAEHVTSQQIYYLGSELAQATDSHENA